MQCPRILLVTGASGVGKTTLLRRLEGRGIPGVSFHYFDSLGVSSAEEITRHWGAPSQWPIARTHQWMERLRNAGGGLAVLDAQLPLHVVRSAFARTHADGHIVLIDCEHATREARLAVEGNEPELNTREMACWASYLRGQADALGVPILDTSALTIDEATERLHSHISTLSAV